MKKIIYLFLSALLFTNCTHRIVRKGYDIKKSDYCECDVVIKKYANVSDLNVSKVGEIKLGESGFAVSCSEEHAITILEKEACAIKADLIVITSETRPDAWSSCYRCRADFYQTNSTDSSQHLKTDELYKNNQVIQRVTEDRKKNKAMVVISAAIGFAIGLLYL